MIGLILRVAIFIVPLVFLAWSVGRWLRSSPKILSPAWRSYTAIAATSLAGTSVLIWIVMGIWAHAIGGFPYYDPVLMRMHHWGFLTGSAGIVAALLGKGKLRWPAFGISALMTFLWFATAMSE